jgi:hypothetical protein
MADDESQFNTPLGPPNDGEKGHTQHIRVAASGFRQVLMMVGPNTWRRNKQGGSQSPVA